MSESCCNVSAEALLFPCAGGSNVGQISNDAAIKLERGGVGRLYCLAGIGGHVEGMVKHAQGVCCIVAIDGCDVCCARKTLEHAGIKPTIHVVVTELGITKARTYDYPDEDVQRVVDALLYGTQAVPGGQAAASSCCGDQAEETDCCKA